MDGWVGGWMVGETGKWIDEDAEGERRGWTETLMNKLCG